MPKPWKRPPSRERCPSSPSDYRDRQHCRGVGVITSRDRYTRLVYFSIFIFPRRRRIWDGWGETLADCSESAIKLADPGSTRAITSRRARQGEFVRSFVRLFVRFGGSIYSRGSRLLPLRAARRQFAFDYCDAVGAQASAPTVRVKVNAGGEASLSSFLRRDFFFARCRRCSTDLLIAEGKKSVLRYPTPSPPVRRTENVFHCLSLDVFIEKFFRNNL